MEAKTMARLKKALLEEKQRLLNNSKHALKHELSVQADDLPDETDLAAHEVNQNLVFNLRNKERQFMGLIDQALARMDEGTYGLCEECEENIEPKRLEARPHSALCIACQERREHRDKIYA